MMIGMKHPIDSRFRFRPGSPWLSVWLTGLCLGALMVSCASTGAGPTVLRSEARVDLERFMGAWYVIANIPYWPERGKVASRDEYRLRDDGRIENVYVFRPDFASPVRRWSGVSRVLPGSHGAHWRVRFVWPFEADLLILEVAEDYSWALLGHPRRRYAWIFGREPSMDSVEYQRLRARFAAHGYDPERILRVPQFAEQVGQPGFQ